MKKLRIIFSAILFFYAVTFLSGTSTVLAESSESNPYFSVTKVSEEISYATNYYLSGWPDRVSPLQTIVNSDGSISVLNANINMNSAAVYEYDQKANYVKTVYLKTEYSKVGAFTKDTEGNYYVVYGKDVEEGAFTDNSVALIKYDAAGTTLNTFLLQAQTYDEKWSEGYSGIWRPFNYGTCRLEISGDMIAAYFARVMFKAPDGLNHQASYGIILNKNTFSRLSGKSDDKIPMPSAGHSFNQFVLPIDGGFMFVDQGDVTPRAFGFAKVSYGSMLTNKSFNFKKGEVYQHTFSALGGIASTSNGYIFAGTYENTTESGDADVNGSRNLYVLTLNDSLTVVSDPIYITDYKDMNTETAVHPKLVQLSDNRYLLLWEKYNSNTKVQTTYMATIDQNGNLLDEPKEVPDTLLSANDILRYNPVTGTVHWAVSQGLDTVVLYSFDVDKPVTGPVSSDPDYLIRNHVLIRYLGNKDEVNIPEGVTEIDRYAFYDSNNIRRVTIPESVVNMTDEYLFYSYDYDPVIIYGKTGSIAQTYAEKHDYIFIDPDIPPAVKGVSDNQYYNSDVTITFNPGKAKLNGKPFNNGLDVYKDGSYKLVVDNGFQVSTTIKFVIDKAAPVIVLKDSSEVKLKSGAATNKSIKLTYRESNLKAIYVTKDKKTITYPSDGQFTAKGSYVVKVTDKAGNSTRVSFTIK